MRRAISDIRASICSENGTVTLAASSASLCLTSPGKMPRALSELVLPSRPQASRPPDLSQERKDFHSLPACPLSPCPGHPLSLAFCPSRFLFPEHLSPAHSCFFLISSLCLEYFFLPESSWQRPACPLKLTSCLWHSLILRVSPAPGGLCTTLPSEMSDGHKDGGDGGDEDGSSLPSSPSSYGRGTM